MSSEEVLEQLCEKHPISRTYGVIRGGLYLTSGLVTTGIGVALGVQAYEVGSAVSLAFYAVAGAMIFAGGTAFRAGVSSLIPSSNFYVFDDGLYTDNPSAYEVENAEIIEPVNALPETPEGVLLTAPVTHSTSLEAKIEPVIREGEHVDDELVGYAINIAANFKGARFDAEYFTKDAVEADALKGSERIYLLTDFDHETPRVLDWGLLNG